MDILTGNLKEKPLANPDRLQQHALKFLQLSAEPICILDWEAHIVWANDSFLSTLAYKESELIHKPLLRFIDSDDLRKSQIELARIVEMEVSSISFTQRFRKKSGETVYFRWNAIPDVEEKLIYVTCRDITNLQQLEVEKKRIIENFNLILRAIDAGVWTQEHQEKSEWWSDNFYKILKYKQGEIKASWENFRELLHPDDLDYVVKRFNAHIDYNEDYQVEMRLLNGQGEYVWVESSCQSIRDENGMALRSAGIMREINEKKQVQIQLEKQEFLLNQTAKILNLGGWELKLENLQPIWSKEIYHIHEVPEDFILNIDSALEFFLEPFRDILKKAVERALEDGIEYDLELMLRTGKGKDIWVRTVGKPVFNQKGRIIGLRGTLQNIHESKLREISLNKSLELISQQNNRLSNFAYVVSHNLRSHISNFNLLLELYQRTSEKEELDKIKEMGLTTFDRLQETIEHLTQVVDIQTGLSQQMEILDIRKVLMRTLDVLSMEIQQSKAIIDTDLSIWYRIKAVPAYLESIFLNLISNSLKYRQPNRIPHIRILSFIEDNKPVISFQDNGLGIDLKKNQEKLFGMFKTFHEHPEAKGIGLFITKNQIEAMGGSIEVGSSPNEGSIFRIYFPEF